MSGATSSASSIQGKTMCGVLRASTEPLYDFDICALDRK